jgi:alkaline phosphatase D
MSSSHFPFCERRHFLRNVTAGGGALLTGTTLGPALAQAGAPALVTSEKMRPQLPSGVMSGDITRDKAVIWSRTDRPARMVVEYADNQAFRDAHKVNGPLALSSSDFTARVDLTGLPAGRPAKQCSIECVSRIFRIQRSIASH